jgi:hypothetical protein
MPLVIDCTVLFLQFGFMLEIPSNAQSSCHKKEEHWQRCRTCGRDRISGFDRSSIEGVIDKNCSSTHLNMHT